MKKILIGSDVSFDEKGRRTFLAEFSPDAKTELTVDSEGEATSFEGLHIFRLINVKREQVALADPHSQKTNLSCLVGVDRPLLVTAQPPRPGLTGYSWMLIQLMSIKEPTGLIFITGARAATENETVHYNKLFPDWLKSVEAMDKRRLM